MRNAQLPNESTVGWIRVFEDATQMLSGVVRDVGHSCWENTTEAASVDEKPLKGSIVKQLREKPTRGESSIRWSTPPRATLSEAKLERWGGGATPPRLSDRKLLFDSCFPLKYASIENAT